MPFSDKRQIRLLQPVLNRIQKPAEKEAQKKPEPLPQVHVQDAGMDHHFTDFLQLCDDTVQAVPAFPDAKVPFDFAPVPGFLPFQLLLLLLDRWISVGFSKFRTVQVNTALLAILHVLPGSEDFVREDPFGVMPVGSLILTNLLDAN